MTQHIEETRKLEPIAAYTIDHTGCWHMSGDVQVLEEIAAKGSLGPTEVVYLVRLSDAQAALVAAEERGRGEERERSESWQPPQDCDGKEQLAFEEWASANGYNMHEHPLHYLFMDTNTYSARQGWKAALKYVRDQFAALTKEPTP